MTILGTRPEIIRLSEIVRLLDDTVEHLLIHTGQNFDDRLDGVFFRDLKLRRPDVHLGVRAEGFGAQVGQLFTRIEPVLLEHRPDRLLVLGDTNSGLAAIVARRLGIPVYHLEAGNRCFDDRVPEEINRRVIDHASTVLMPYTERSRENLIAEGIAGRSIYVIGNPIKEILDVHEAGIDGSRILGTLGLSERSYFLVTMHRAENVDQEGRLKALVEALGLLHTKFGFPVICSLHPRTRSKLVRFGIEHESGPIRFLEPLGFHDFIRLERSAFCVLSDSGTVQEETCILRVPNVTIRDVTERPETVECGSNLLVGSEPERILRGVEFVAGRAGAWTPPSEYLRADVSETVVRLVTGFRPPDAAERAWIAGHPSQS